MAAFGSVFQRRTQIHQIVKFIRNLKPDEEPQNPHDFSLQHLNWLRAAFVGAALAFLAQFPAQARTLAEIRQLGQISMCANEDALPFRPASSRTARLPVELGRAIAAGLGFEPEHRMDSCRAGRASTVNMRHAVDSVADPKLHEGQGAAQPSLSPFRCRLGSSRTRRR